MTDIVTSYDQVPYAYYSFPDSHPRRLQAVARLLGLETAAPAQCRVLELGCAVGGNVVPMAYSLPKAQFIGIDLVESQIESARKFATACSLTNLDLRAANIMEVTPGWGQFDYIIAHGVFSWVPHEVAEKVLQLCGELLAPNGLAYISLNTYPGAHARMWVREAMLFHADAFLDPIQKVRAGREFILSLARTPLLSALLHPEVQYFENNPDSYLVHEYLEGTNHPFYFRDFAARSASHGLQYLGDAIQNGIVGAENSPGFRNWLEANARDLIRLEQYADFVRNRVFRRALLCRENVTLDRSQLPARAETMQVAAFFRQTAEANGMTHFQHSLGARRVVGPGPLHHLDAGPEVAGRVLAVDVHPHDDIALGLGDEPVHPGRLQPVRVVDHAEARVGRRQAGQDLAGAIGAAPVGHQDLDPVPRVVLRLHAGDALRDVALLVEAGHRDGDQRADRLRIAALVLDQPHAL